MSSILTPLSTKINLPVVGAVSATTLLIAGAAIYFGFIRNRRRVSSITTRYSRR